MKLFDYAKEQADLSILSKRLKAAVIKIEECRGMSDYETDAFKFACQNASVVKMQYGEARRRLKENRIRPIVFAWAKESIITGKDWKSEKEIYKEIDLFDESAMLTPTEFFSLSDVIILEGTKVFLKSLEKTISIQKSMIDAQKWMENDSPLPADFDPVFFLEHALTLSSEKGDQKKRKEIIDCIQSIGKSEETIVKIACDEISDLVLKFSNVVSIMHTVINMDWMDVFQKTSHIEQTLMSDKSGIYPKMDEESKSAIRREIEEIHKYTRVPQRRIATCALNLSQNERNGITQFLYTDDGRTKLLKEINAIHKNIPRMIPDPKGHRIILAILFALAILGAITCIILNPLYLFLLLPCIFVLSEDLVRRIFNKCTVTRPLLSLNFEEISDENRTLVVIPALLTSPKGAENALNNLSSYGVHEKCENIDFLLLGDFKDSKNAVEENDDLIVRKVKKEIESLNAHNGRRKYFFIYRNRIFNETDQIYMGYERKRGALMDLNRLLLGYGNRFSSESEDAGMLVGRYKYVLTIDMDTKILPGTIRKMIGTMAHPLNADYAVLQPRMENTGIIKPNLFSSWMAGFGGTDHYDVCCSDFYQDVTGEGLFSGKGIYNIQSFYEKTAEAFQENTILSHDMIEGILSRAGYLGNIVMYESFPETTGAYYKRLDRWTRGDWQLVHYLFGRIRLNALGRFKIIGNLLRSLQAASLLTGLVLSVWTNQFGLLNGLLVFHFLPVILNGFGAMKPCLLKFALLPVTAYTEARAALTALARLYITKQKRLEWVTAAESEKTGKTINYPGIIAAILIIPGLFSGVMSLYSVIIGAIFAFGKDLIDSFDHLFRNESIKPSDYTYLTDLAKRMWRYFEKYVPLTGSGFPPDNVQIDPPIGIQARTSPTNIGMYLISVIGAKELGLIEESELIARIKQTLLSIRKIETWNGLMYNWYDINTLEPSLPRYVSSVDAGNFMASCVIVRNYFKEYAPSISSEYDALIQKMDIGKLFNSKRKLFRIGIDVGSNRLSASHYDLFSSESRILSYTAMAEKGIPISHWTKLARPFFFHKGKSALYSWSGTMFEYMMPNLVMPSACQSLMKNSMETAIDLQTKKTQDGIWGISEAGYAGFDQMLNYQYKAFGIKQLALSGEVNESVYAPYAVLLALEHAFSKGMDSLKRMQEAGMKGEYGFYEAIDFSKKEKPKIVYSYMSHHQGMGFMAICNLLTNNSLKNLFLDHPREQALTPLLNEKPFLKPLYKRLLSKSAQKLYPKEDIAKKRSDFLTFATGAYPRGHLLFSSGAIGYFESTGRSFFKKDGIFANIFSHDSENRNSTLLPEIQDESGKAEIEKCQFDTSCAEYELCTKTGRYKIILTINPENGELLIKVKLKNEKNKQMEIKIRHSFRLSLNNEDMNYAHPVFSDLFVKTEKAENFGFVHARKNRDTLANSDYLYHLTDQNEKVYEDGRKTHGKYSSIDRVILLAPYEKKEVFFSVSIEKKPKTSFENLDSALFDHAQTLLMGQMNAHIQFCGLSDAEYRSIDRRAIGLMSFKARDGEGSFQKSNLWPLGLSGEGRILLVNLKSKGDLTNLKRAVRMHAFFKFANIPITIVILKLKETEYFTPLKDAAINHLLSGHLSGCIGKEDGAMIFDSGDLNSNTIKALELMDLLKEAPPSEQEVPKENAPLFTRTLPGFDENALIAFNGFGGFLKDSNAYLIKITKERKPPRRWSNFLSNEAFGAIVNDLGISSIYYKNSRTGRITAFDNNLDDPNESVQIIAKVDGRKLPLFPGKEPIGEYTVIHDTGKSVYSVKTDEVCVSTTVCVHPNKALFLIGATIENKKADEASISLAARVRFLMGIDDRDLLYLRLSTEPVFTLAYGSAGFTACAGFTDGEVSNGGMTSSFKLKANEKRMISFCIAVSENDGEIKEMLNNVNAEDIIKACSDYWNLRMNSIQLSNGNPLLVKLANGFMKYQTIASRYFARFGPYQPGGAFGMRDQLQDLLSIMYFDRALARKHILLSAARQFEKGDGLHWWHMPANGVRTRISDDVLFLAVVTAKYVEETGDSEILKAKVPYLKNKEIPDNALDFYGSFEETEYTETLYDHILKAFRYTLQYGSHGLLLMGTGDWNDGMNRVGMNRKGESIWLSEFWIYTANAFKNHANQDDRRYLERNTEDIKRAIEKHAWDGKWYLRAFYDDGKKLGSSENEECRIDLLAQAWAVLSGLDPERSKTALKSVEEHLIDQSTGIVRLLNPPFTGKEGNPGYIAAYPAGIRENGGQYTHAVAWLVKAYAKLGNAEMAWKVFDMLLPLNRTNTFESALKYGGEPYVLSADIVNQEGEEGACGWTWYTGAAAWATRVLYEDLIGLEIRGDKVRIKPLLDENMDEVKITIQNGSAKYVLFGKKGKDAKDEFIKMKDDGNVHKHFFPPRNEKRL